MNVDKMNGWGVIFRFITPLMVFIIAGMMTYILNDIREMKISLNNHLQHDVADIRERIARIETILTK